MRAIPIAISDPYEIWIPKTEGKSGITEKKKKRKKKEKKKVIQSSNIKSRTVRISQANSKFLEEEKTALFPSP